MGANVDHHPLKIEKIRCEYVTNHSLVSYKHLLTLVNSRVATVPVKIVVEQKCDR